MHYQLHLFPPLSVAVPHPPFSPLAPLSPPSAHFKKPPKKKTNYSRIFQSEHLPAQREETSSSVLRHRHKTVDVLCQPTSRKALSPPYFRFTLPQKDTTTRKPYFQQKIIMTCFVTYPQSVVEAEAGNVAAILHMLDSDEDHMGPCQGLSHFSFDHWGTTTPPSAPSSPSETAECNSSCDVDADGTDGTTTCSSSSDVDEADLPPLTTLVGVEGDLAPCEHNCWTRSRGRKVTRGLRLRCLVCRALWTTVLDNHSKCPDFYAGKCDGACGRPHILARGTVPKDLHQEDRATALNQRSLKDILVDKPRVLKAKARVVRD